MRLKDAIRRGVPYCRTVMFTQLNRWNIRGGMTQPQFHAQSLGFNNQMRNRRFPRGRVYILTNEMQTRDGLEDLVHLREDLYQLIVDTLFRRYVIDDIYHY